MKILLPLVLRSTLRRPASQFRRLDAYLLSNSDFHRNYSFTVLRFASTSNKGDGNSNDSPATDSVKLPKPGAMGKAGQKRQELEASVGDDQKKPKKPAVKKDDSNNSDDELMSSSSSSDDEAERKEKKEADKPSQVLSPELLQAIKEVSESLGGDEKRTRVDLLKKMMEHEKDSYDASKIREIEPPTPKQKKKKTRKAVTPPGEKLGTIMGKMAKADIPAKQRQPRPEMVRASNEILQRFKKTSRDEEPDDGRQERQRPSRPAGSDDGSIQYERTDFFNRGPGLDIFTPVIDKLKPSYPPLLPVWENLERRRLKQLTAREPRNGFEEFTRWTEEGKMWPYPIDNDYGHYEQNVNFHEHVFLDQLLDEGFPKIGPIRQFMELVVHGLSSNPYMTVEKKHGHIAWFREYFEKRGAEIEKLHSLDVKHQEALAQLENSPSVEASSAESKAAP